MATSNIDDVVRTLAAFVHSFNFTLPGIDQSLGRDLAGVVARGIQRRAAKESRGKDPQRWYANSDKYRRVKAKAYGWGELDGKPNFRTGQMLSLMSLLGTPRVTPDLVEMIYGTGTAPAGCWSPWDQRTEAQKTADMAMTDVEKAEYAHDQYKNRPARPFYEWNEDIRDQCIETAAKALDHYLDSW
jgi:hypothetical protein